MGEIFLGELGRHLDNGNIWSLAEGIKKSRDFSVNRNENKSRGGKVKARSGMLGSGNSSVRLWRASLQNVFSGSINLDRWLDNELKRREWLKCDSSTSVENEKCEVRMKVEETRRAPGERCRKEGCRRKHRDCCGHTQLCGYLVCALCVSSTLHDV